ncbi:protein MAIN-LIKE 1-like [Vicia villosa]|uniref:protein MAIN-LIKE 1-like n=1 Tax=Vicia villosa TaxID=3911 RepID=UPI00273A8DD0|nr:protein MAIN-LIKE 1-like [Vicia villosa]
MPPPHRRRRDTSSTSTPVHVAVTGDVGFVVPPTQGHEDEPVLEPIWYPGGLVDASLLTGYDEHATRRIWDGESRDPQRFCIHGRKIKNLAQPNEPWFHEVLEASGMRDLCMLGYETIHNSMLAAFAERWHPETSLFHLLHSEITIILDDVACLLHLPIRGILLCHSRLTNAKAQDMLIAESRGDPDDALEEVERTRSAHVRFRFLQRHYDAMLTAAQHAEGGELEQATHRERALRCYFLYLIGTHLFVDTSSSYTDVVYVTYLSDMTRIHEYNWGAVVLAYIYHRLGEECLWKARTVAGNWLDTTALSIHYWLGRGRGVHRGHAACQCFHPPS